MLIFLGFLPRRCRRLHRMGSVPSREGESSTVDRPTWDFAHWGMRSWPHNHAVFRECLRKPDNDRNSASPPQPRRSTPFQRFLMPTRCTLRSSHGERLRWAGCFPPPAQGRHSPRAAFFDKRMNLTTFKRSAWVCHGGCLPLSSEVVADTDPHRLEVQADRDPARRRGAGAGSPPFSVACPGAFVASAK